MKISGFIVLALLAIFSVVTTPPQFRKLPPRVVASWRRPSKEDPSYWKT